MNVRPGGEATHEWFAVQVWTSRERLSATHLQQRGYDVFLPSYRERHVWSDRVKHIERALFAGYLFCRIRADVVGRIITSPGVIRVVGDGREPLPIPESEIESIRRITETRTATEPYPFVQAGQQVRIETGPLRGTEGIVLHVKDRRRLVVSVRLLQRAVAVDMDSDWVSVPCAASLGRTA